LCGYATARTAAHTPEFPHVIEWLVTMPPVASIKVHWLLVCPHAPGCYKGLNLVNDSSVKGPSANSTLGA